MKFKDLQVRVKSRRKSRISQILSHLKGTN